MTVTVNGQPVTLPPGATIDQALEQLSLGEGPCAVEVNRVVVPKRDHPARRLKEGDRVEIVTLVGGG